MTPPDSTRLGSGRMRPSLVDLSLLTQELTGAAGLAPGPCLLHIPVFPMSVSYIAPMILEDMMTTLPAT